MRKFLIILFIILYLPTHVNALPPLVAAYLISASLHAALLGIVFHNKLGKTDKVGVVAVKEKKEEEKLIELEIIASNRLQEVTQEKVAEGKVKASAKSSASYNFSKSSKAPQYHSATDLDDFRKNLERHTVKGRYFNGVSTYKDFNKKYGLPETITHKSKVYVRTEQVELSPYKSKRVIMVAECTIDGDECHSYLNRQLNGENIQSLNKELEDLYELPQSFEDDGRLILRVMMTIEVGNTLSKEFVNSDKNVSFFKEYVANLGYVQIYYYEYDKALDSQKKLLLAETNKNPMENAANVYFYLNETYDDYNNTYTADQLRDILKHLAVTNPSKLSTIENSNLARSLNLNLSAEREFKHDEIEVTVEDSDENYFGTNNSVPDGINYQGILNEIMNSEMFRNASNTYSNTGDIDELTKSLHDGIEKLLAGIPNGSKLSFAIANHTVGTVLNSLKNGGFGTALAGSLSDKLGGGNGDGSGGSGDNGTGTSDIVGAINSLPDKVIGSSSGDVPYPTFDVGISFDNTSKKSIGSLFDKINMPLLNTLKDTRLNLADASCSVSINVYNRNIEFSVCGYEEQMSYVGQLMVAFATLTSIIYVFRRD